VVLCIRQHELRRRHGCRAGRSLRARTSRLLPCLRPVGNGAFIVSTSRAPQRPGQCVNINNAVPSTRYNVRLDQHVTPLSFGFLNIRSLLKKLDDILELRRDRLFDVLCLVETWHYSDSVCVQRLRAEGFRVIDRARQRLDSGCSTAPNYSGIILFSTSRVRMSLIDVACASTFDVVSIRLTSGSYHCVLVVIYRPGSVAVTVKFFTELAGVLDRVAVLSEPVFVAGDVNIRLDPPNESPTRQLVALFASRGLLISATESTHDGGGTIDVVASSSAVGAVQGKRVALGYFIGSLGGPFFPRDFCLFPVNYRRIITNYCCRKWSFTISQRSVRLGVVCGPREPQWERMGRNADRRRRSALYRISRNTARARRPGREFHHRTLSVALLRRRSRLLANARVTARRRVLQAYQHSICHCTNPTAICQPAHPTPARAPRFAIFPHRTRLANTLRVEISLFRRIYPRRVNCCRQSTFTSRCYSLF
jgi:hypothetical protein